MSIHRRHFSQTPKASFVRPILFLSVLLLAIVVWFNLPTIELSDDDAWSPKHVDLRRLEGPWFEVARLPHDKEKAIKNPLLFFKYAGAGQEGMNPYPDPSDPRFRVIVTGQSVEGSPTRVIDVMTDPVKDYNAQSVSIPCFRIFHCPLLLLAFDNENKVFMVVAGPTKNELWIFSRTPGLPVKVMSDLKNRLKQWGYGVENLVYSNEPPEGPEVVPPAPKDLPDTPEPPRSGAPVTPERGSD